MSTTPGPGGVPSAYAGLVDDATAFSPAAAPLEIALAEHRRHRRSWYADLIGTFLVDDRRLTSLLELLEEDESPVPVRVVVTGGAGAVEPAARWATSSPALELRGLEVALRDLDDLPGSARRLVAAVDHAATDLGVEVPVYVEPPLVQATGADAGWLAALDELAAADLRLALRTAGLVSDQVPSVTVLSTALTAALDRELSFTCTGGPHHAVRHKDPTGIAQHGFLNVLLATRASLDGADVEAALEQRDATAVVMALEEAAGDALVRARRWFRSFSCRRVEDPWADLVSLSLI